MAWIKNMRNWQRFSDSKEYMKQVYGDSQAHLQQEKATDFCTEREFYGDFGYGQCFNSTSTETQCELIHGQFDPSTLSYEKRMAWHLREFCYKTSAHGIPMIGQAPNRYYRAKSIDLVARTLSAFDGAMNKAGDSPPVSRFKRKINTTAETSMAGSLFEPGFSKCNCNDASSEIDEGSHECEGEKYKTEVPEKESEKCICAFDRKTNDAWPCYLENHWLKEECATCDDHAFCTKRGPPGVIKKKKHPCLCAPSGSFCVAYDGKADILQIWKYLSGVEPTEDPGFIEAMGFGGMTDEVAIVTKAKENIMFAMATLSMKERMLLSNTLKELVHKCSFNGAACDIENDFLTHVDPTYGSCFTYNFDRSKHLTSARAGSLYGLRILVYVNSTEYMPTTEATGVRLTIHEKEEFPFPDTFGYSAPTGYISSFGLKLRRMTRLPAPYGDCVRDGKTKDYVYNLYEYTVEGCYRSCFQQLVLKDCHCGDPRFPVPEGHSHCKAIDPVARKCLDEKLQELGGVHGSFRCRCQQPCKQSIYSVTYSAAKWPSLSLQIQLGACEGSSKDCNQHYKENAAMVEVFYEQLNYEMLTESEAYGLVNLLGLWCGISFLTCCEFIFLFFETSWMSAKHHYEIYKRKKEEKRRAKEIF